MKVFITLICLTVSLKILAISAVEALDGDSLSPLEKPLLVTETIKKISPTKRIFIITNSNSSYYSGDFISIIYKKHLVARAIVAKTQGELSGIKVIRIDSLPLWKELKTSLEVQILRGDDSYYYKMDQEMDGSTSKVQDEMDLYNETTLLEDNLNLDEKKGHHIKTDNILALNFSLIAGVDDNQSAAYYQQFNATWAYQLTNNIWGEICIGRSYIKDFPGPQAYTTFTNFLFKIKYTIVAPFYSYLLPYVGYHKKMADAPELGVNQTDEQTAKEEQLISLMNSDDFILGVTILKRLVPGWFFRLNIGTDSISGGLALEY